MARSDQTRGECKAASFLFSRSLFYGDSGIRAKLRDNVTDSAVQAHP